MITLIHAPEVFTSRMAAEVLLLGEIYVSYCLTMRDYSFEPRYLMSIKH